MNKLYSVHDHWTDINKKNDVDIESIDGVIAGIKVNGEDYSGISWTQVFTGDVVTSGEAAPFSGTIPAELSGADTIKVIYNDNVYILNKQTQDEIYYYGATIGAGPQDIDFSVYPFVIVHIDDSNVSLYTESPGPQNLTIFELQSGGGSSDFSTAIMTVISSSDGVFGKLFLDPNSPFYSYGAEAYADTEVPSQTIAVLLYQGVGWLDTYGAALTIGSVSGSIEYDSVLESYKITGDCSVTIISANAQ